MPYSVNIWYGYFVNGLADGHKIINAQNGLKWRFLRKWIYIGGKNRLFQRKSITLCKILREYEQFFIVFHVKNGYFTIFQFFAIKKVRRSGLFQTFSDSSNPAYCGSAASLPRGIPQRR